MKALRILLADDSPSIGEMICGQLRSNGHQVRFVTSGEAAVAAFREETPELVLMDIEMPGIGGLEAIRRIRRIPTQTWVPVIIVTGHHDEAHLLDGFMAGADDYLHKPVQPLLLDLRIQAMIRIVASQRSATATVDQLIEGVIRIDRAGRITAFNKAAEGIFGYAAREVLGENVKMLMPSPHREAHDTYIGDYLATGERRIIGIGREVQGQRKNGELFPMHLGVSEVETPDEQFFVGIVHDLSEENALRAALSENRHFLADVIENSPDATYVKDRAGRYLLVNRAQEEVTGLPRAATLGRTDAELFPAEMAEAYRQVDLAVMQTGHAIKAEESLRDERGETFFLSVKFPTRSTEGDITGICGISTDITQIKHYQKELERLSQYDELTGLCNRRHFMGLARHELGRSQRYGGKLSLLMVDIDHFKRVNDSHGHRTGDLVLAAVSEQIRKALRDADIAGRLGGEEFAVMLPETGLGGAILVAERLRQQIATQAIDIGDGQTLQCTLSIGVACLDDATIDLEKLLHRADTALYSAKNGGRNKVVSYAADRPA